MTFNNQFIGHAVVGYDGPNVYNSIFKRYLSRLSIAISLINNRNNLITSLGGSTNASLESEQSASSNTQIPETIFVQKDNVLLKVPLENILFFESENRKTIAVMKSGRYEIKKTLSQLEELYSNRNFLRVSKSTLVNLSKIISIAPDVDRTLLATLSGKITVHVSRKHANIFKEKVNIL
jgi:DNA-binding LytR/AlgR family response regulator